MSPRLNLNEEDLQRFVGGITQIRNTGMSTFRGEITSVSITGKGDKRQIVIVFAYLEKLETGISTSKWVRHEQDPTEYKANLTGASLPDESGGRLCLDVPNKGDVIIFFLPVQ